MSRPEMRLEAERFTNTSALAREILALLEVTDYNLTIEMTPKEQEEVEAELDGCKTMGRVKLVIRETKIGAMK